jgi:aminoglycoside phosphotransferase (APT) family kinase protein
MYERPLSLRARLERYYGAKTDPAVTVTDFVPISDGWETEVYSFTQTLHHQVEPRILRMYPGDHAAAKCEREWLGMSGMMWHHYPVPRVFRFETDAAWMGKPFIIMRKIDGRPLGEVMREDTARQPELLTRFVELFVRLHRIYDYRPNLEHFTYDNPQVYTPRTLAHWRKAILADWGQAWAQPVLDWLDAHQPAEAPAISPLHGDYHPHNLLITPDDQLYVIDWSGFAVGDYRVDLAWTLLISTSGYPELRPIILSEYARLAGHPVEAIEYFDVLAALKRLFEFAVSVGSGAEGLGMRPEAVALMRERGDHYQQVYDLLCERSGLRLPEIEQLLNSSKA